MKKSDLERIAELARSHVFHPGDILIRKGGRYGRLFIIVSGEVEVIKDLGGRSKNITWGFNLKDK
jgi:CRP-like cAMP-binding protein